MPEAFVVNASPLIFLGNAGHLELLRSVGPQRVVVPDAVFAEVADSRHCDRASNAVTSATWIERAAAAEIPARVVEWDLGSGESQVIAVALQMPDARAIIDDLAGRRCALALGVDVQGTLSVLVAASRRGLVPDLRRAIEEVRATGMWLSDAVIARAVALAERRK